MKIGIIGAGHIGGTLARKFTAAGHTVTIANSRGPETLKDLAADIGARAVFAVDAVKDVDVVIISIPEKNIPQLPKDLFAGVPATVIVVDTGNYYPGRRDGPIEAIERGIPESCWVTEQIGRPVVKAFNSIFANSLASKGRPAGAADRIALPVAGDDAHAKEVVIGLVIDAGFDGIDAGSLAESWRQQPGSPAYCTDLGVDDLRRALALADRARNPQLRDLATQRMAELGEKAMSEDRVSINRALHPELGK